jgi:RNA polymerase-associated protein LEO1
MDAEKAGAGLPGFAGINGYLYVSQKARIRVPKKQEGQDAENEAKEDEEVEEEAQPAGTVLECLGPILSRFAPRPSSLASEAHRNLTNAIRQRNVKRARIAEIVTDFDPEKEKAARIKGKDDLNKSQYRGARRSGGGGGRRKLNSNYLEEDDDYDGVNLGRLKRQTMRRDYSEDEMDYGEDSESEEDEWSKNKKRKRPAVASSGGSSLRKKKDVEESESSEEGEVVFGDDDEEEDGAMFKKRGGGAKKSNVLDDDDD